MAKLCQMHASMSNNVFINDFIIIIIKRTKTRRKCLHFYTYCTQFLYMQFSREGNMFFFCLDADAAVVGWFAVSLCYWKCKKIATEFVCMQCMHRMKFFYAMGSETKIYGHRTKDRGKKPTNKKSILHLMVSLTLRLRKLVCAHFFLACEKSDALMCWWWWLWSWWISSFCSLA